MKRLITTTTMLIVLSTLAVGLRAGELEDLIRRVNDSIAHYARLGNSAEQAGWIAGRATVFYNNALSDSIIHYVPHDLETLKKLQQWDRYYETWTYLINTYIYYNNSKNLALREVQTMFDDARKRENTYGMGIAYYTMGNVYISLNNLDESATAYRKGLDLLLSLSPKPPVIQEIYSYYGDVLNDQKKYNELDKLTKEWKTFLDEQATNPDINASQQKVLRFFYDIACVQAATGLGHYDRAERTLDDAHSCLTSEEDFMGAAWLSNAAQLRLVQGRTAEAMQLNSQRMALLSPDEDKSNFLVVYLQRAEILEKLDRYQEAAQLYRTMYFTKDSLNSADTKSQLTEMNTLFQVDELKMEKERAQFRLMMIIVGIVIAALAIFTIFRIRADRRLKKAHGQLQATHEELLTAYDQLEETTAAKERIESDLRIARNIQMGMVPRRFPQRDDLDIYALMTPAKEVGGDLYGIYINERCNDNDSADQLYFCVGDVSGKGVPASLFMAQATRLFRTLAAQQMKPDEIATRINNALSGEDNEAGMFVTMFIGLADLKTGRLDFCNCGHNPPVLMRNGKPEFLKMLPNTPVGIIEGLDYKGEAVEDIRNAMLFVYTDGLNEAENNEHEQFTDERLIEILEKTPFENCQQTINLLSNAVEQHREGAEPNDDLTMLCFEVKTMTT